MSKWTVYIIRTRSGALYTGVTTDMDRRLAEHAGGGPRGSKYLRSRSPLALAYQVRIGGRALAAKVEWRVKRLSKEKKEEIVSACPARRALLAILDLPG